MSQQSRALPPAYVINLDRAPERWARMMQTCPDGLTLNRFAAVDGACVPDVCDIGGQDFVKPERMSRNEFACLLSHAALWSRLANSGEAAMMILEDDASLPPDFVTRCHAFMAKLPADFDIAYLTYNTNMHVRLEMPGLGEIVLMHDQEPLPPEILWAPEQVQQACRLYRAWGSAAYVLSKQGAEKLLKHFTMAADTTYPPYYFAIPNGLGGHREFNMPTEQLDLHLLPVLESLQAYVAVPMLCLPDLAVASTIGDRGWV